MSQSKVAFVTGGGGGIGKTIAIEFAKKGYDVAISYLGSELGAQETICEIEKCGQRAKAYKTDVSKCEDIKKMFEKFQKDFDRLDVFVNNAGVTVTSKFLETTEQDFDFMCNVDFKGAYFCMQGAAKIMVEKSIAGSIVLISSNHASSSGANVSVYGSVKAAASKLVRHAAAELAKYGIRVNCIEPGFTDTGAARMGNPEDTYYKIPLRKWATSKEIADNAIFLSSESCASVTGATIVIDNGALLQRDLQEKYF